MVDTGLAVVYAILAFIVAALLVGAWVGRVLAQKRPPERPPAVRNRTALEKFVRDNVEGWLAEDAALFDDAPNWKVRVPGAMHDGVNLQVRERKDPSGNANHLFWYYAESILNVPAHIAGRLFGVWIRQSQHWTKELTYAEMIMKTDWMNVEIWWEFYVPSLLPRLFGVQPRVLIAAYVAIDELDCTLVSARSVPPVYIDLRSLAKWPLIDWHGAFRFKPLTAESCSVVKIDREDQGGWFPAALMNMTMPKFLSEEVTKATHYVNVELNIDGESR